MRQSQCEQKHETGDQAKEQYFKWKQNPNLFYFPETADDNFFVLIKDDFISEER